MPAIRSGSSGIKQTANASVDPANSGHEKLKRSNTSNHNKEGNEPIVKNGFARFVSHETGQNGFHRPLALITQDCARSNWGTQNYHFI
jgi:hypothetical protein